jgi:nicotinate phosphoribosyltransferase
MAYKLVEYAGRERVKLSEGKVLLPGAKQVYRQEEDGVARGDVLTRRGDVVQGRPLLRPVMRAGKRLPGASPPLADVRACARREVSRLPREVRALAPARPPYPVRVGTELERARAAQVEAWSAAP